MTLRVGGVKKTAPVKKRTLKKKTISSAPKKLKKTQGKKKPLPKSAKPGQANLERKLIALGDKRKDAEEAHKEAVDELFEAILESVYDRRITVTRVSEITGISRQWIYKGLEARTNS